MPKIIIQTEGPHRTATLSERVVPAEAQSHHYLEQLIERVGWALQDAEDLEAAAQPPPIAPDAEAKRTPSRPVHARSTASS
jgi:hypothetical protein